MKKIAICFVVLLLSFSVSFEHIRGFKVMHVHASEKKKETISLAIWDSSPEESDLLQKVIYNFQREHPNITVDLRVATEQANFPFIIVDQMKSYRGPDVYYAHSYEIPYYVGEGVAENLDDYISKSSIVDTQDFFPFIYDKFQLVGSTYALPKGFTTFCLFYNEKLFKKQKVKPPKTVEEFQKAAVKLTSKKGVYGFGLNLDLPIMFTTTELFGAKMIEKGRATFADDRIVKAVDMLNAMIQQDKSIGIASVTGYKTIWEGFAKERFAMMTEGLYVVPYLRANAQGVAWKVAPVPMYKGKKSTRIDTVGYVINKKSKNKKAAWKLVEYLTSKKGMDEWTKKGLEMPARKSVFEEQKWPEKKEYKPFIEAMDYAQFFTSDKNVPIIRSRFNQAVSSFYYGIEEPKEALTEAQNRANHYIDLKEKAMKKER